MNDIDPRNTLGELVTEHPHLARAFDDLGLDYCCGGARSLDEACAAAGLDPDALQLHATSTGTDHGAASEWVSLDLAELTLHLEATHHAYLHRELPRLAALADKVVGVHGDRHPELAEVRAQPDRAARRSRSPSAAGGASALPDDPSVDELHEAPDLVGADT